MLNSIKCQTIFFAKTQNKLDKCFVCHFILLVNSVVHFVYEKPIGSYVANIFEAKM